MKLNCNLTASTVEWDLSHHICYHNVIWKVSSASKPSCYGVSPWFHVFDTSCSHRGMPILMKWPVWIGLRTRYYYPGRESFQLEVEMRRCFGVARTIRSSVVAGNMRSMLSRTVLTHSAWILTTFSLKTQRQHQCPNMIISVMRCG